MAWKAGVPRATLSPGNRELLWSKSVTCYGLLSVHHAAWFSTWQHLEKQPVTVLPRKGYPGGLTVHWHHCAESSWTAHHKQDPYKPSHRGPAIPIQTFSTRIHILVLFILQKKKRQPKHPKRKCWMNYPMSFAQHGSVVTNAAWAWTSALLALACHLGHIN